MESGQMKGTWLVYNYFVPVMFPWINNNNILVAFFLKIIF